jgi:hypothetical protein
VSYVKDSEFSSGVGAIAAVDAVTNRRKQLFAKRAASSTAKDRKLAAVSRGALGAINLASHGGQNLFGSARASSSTGIGSPTPGGASGPYGTGPIVVGGGSNPLSSSKLPAAVSTASRFGLSTAVATPLAPATSTAPNGTFGLLPGLSSGTTGSGSGTPPGSSNVSGGTVSSGNTGTPGGTVVTSGSSNTVPVPTPPAGTLCPAGYVATSQGCQYVPATTSTASTDQDASGGGGAGLVAPAPTPDTSVGPTPTLDTGTDYTPYLIAGAAAIGLYLLLRRRA